MLQSGCVLTRCDAVSVFFNGVLVFSGNSSYTSRDPGFQGIVGLFDAVHVPFKKGENELTLLVIENFVLQKAEQ